MKVQEGSGYSMLGRIALFPWSAVLLVEQRGIEPLTSALRTRRSAKLSYCPTTHEDTVSSFEFQAPSFKSLVIRNCPQISQIAQRAKSLRPRRRRTDPNRGLSAEAAKSV